MLLNLFKKMQKQRRFAMTVLLLSTLVFALSSALWRGLDSGPGRCWPFCVRCSCCWR